MDSSEDASRRVHIAIVRFTSLGDVIHTLPMAAAIRRHLPQARITWLVEEREQILLRENPIVDEIVIVPLRRWREGLTSLTSARQSIAELSRVADLRNRAAGVSAPGVRRRGSSRRRMA
jgi:ADP-heptose:LPS heptosyltransferase